MCNCEKGSIKQISRDAELNLANSTVLLQYLKCDSIIDVYVSSRNHESV